MQVGNLLDTLEIKTVSHVTYADVSSWNLDARNGEYLFNGRKLSKALTTVDLPTLVRSGAERRFRIVIFDPSCDTVINQLRQLPNGIWLDHNWITEWLPDFSW